MAARDHKDLQSRSQDLSLSFTNYFLESEIPWFVKDADSRYVQASPALLSLYGIDGQAVYGKTDYELNVLSIDFCNQMKCYEEIVLRTNEKIFSLEINYFNKSRFTTPRVFSISPFVHNKECMTITFVRTDSIINVNKTLLSIVGVNTQNKSDIEITLNNPISEFANINPLDVKELTEKQWQVAWYVLLGLSYRDIASLTKNKPSNVVKKLNKAYFHLGVNSLKNFLYIGQYYNWILYIPPSMKLPTSSVINFR